VLILANYTSAWAGMLLLGGRLSRQPDVTLENVQIWLGIFAILAFLLTLVIEYPCFWWLLRQRQRSWQTALKATLLIHGISYLLLFGWYSLSSQTSLLTQLSVVPAAQLQPSDSYTLYYLNPEGTQALRSDLTGANPVAIAQTDFEAVAPETPQVFGPVPRLAATTDWDYYTSVFAGGGFSGINRTTRESVHFALETPFALWSISHATHLTGDLVVFQLGRDQICLLHPPTQRLALVARGKNPVVTHPHGGPPSPPSSL
jgi:uncharacterized protein YhhL (DUF1145 family)